jgi:hypothetical protein
MKMIEKHDLGKKIWNENLEKSINKIKKREKHKNSQKKIFMESEISGLRQVICLELPSRQVLRNRRINRTFLRMHIFLFQVIVKCQQI